jgi:hypothetical protein
VGAHFADLVEKYRPAIGQSQLAGIGGVGTGECTPFVAEQLALQQPIGDRGTIDADHRGTASRAQHMDRLGDPFLAGTGLSGDQNAGLRGGELRQIGPQPLHRSAIAYDAVHGLSPRAESPVAVGRPGEI